MNSDRKATTYKDAGVDIDAADSLVDALQPLVAKTARPGVKGEIGGFGGLFDLKAEGFQDPLLVSATDGVGTKLKIAIETGRLGTIGIDLVAMCVNDIVVQGAEPLFFLDYFATAKLDPAAAEQVISGIATGCVAAGCALIGGETAEMPGLYAPGEFDLAGFAVGAVERDGLITGGDIQPGDQILGLAASGFHSNGYSLLRRLVQESGLKLADDWPGESGESVGDCLLRPTRIYVKPLLAALDRAKIQGLAHITGGGLLENIPRILPGGLTARLDAGSWTLPPEQAWVQTAANLSPREMARTFNCGIGMIAIVRKEAAETIADKLAEDGEQVFAVGRIEAGPEGSDVVISGPEGMWGQTQAWTAQRHDGDDA